MSSAVKFTGKTGSDRGDEEDHVFRYPIAHRMFRPFQVLSHLLALDASQLQMTSHRVDPRVQRAALFSMGDVDLS